VEEQERLFAMSGRVIAGAMAVHSKLGPGLLESAYEACLAYELEQRGLHVEAQKPLPLMYGEVRLEAAYRLDLLVEREIIVEIKTVEAVLPVHKAQLLTYLKLSQLRVGLLINFNVTSLKDGVHRVLHRL
jgi:GxxExxY protein